MKTKSYRALSILLITMLLLTGALSPAVGATGVGASDEYSAAEVSTHSESPEETDTETDESSVGDGEFSGSSGSETPAEGEPTESETDEVSVEEEVTETEEGETSEEVSEPTESETDEVSVEEETTESEESESADENVEEPAPTEPTLPADSPGSTPPEQNPEESNLAGQAPSTPQAKENTYPINYTIIESEEARTSVVDQYFNKPATVVTDDEQLYVQIELNQSDLISRISVEYDGNWIEVEEISRDISQNTKVVQFQVTDLSAWVNALVETYDAELGTYETYDVRFALGADYFPPAEIQMLTMFLQSDELADGRYDIQFMVLKNGTDTKSVMDGYTEKPATLVVENGEKRIYLTLTNSSWIKEFKVEVDGQYVDADVIRIDEENDTRVVGFNISSLEEKLNAKTHVVIPDGVLPFPYDNRYDVQISFDVESIEDGTSGPEPGAPIVPEPEEEEEDLADGHYIIQFTAIHAEKEDKSAVDSYLNKPARLTVVDEKKYITLTINRSATITGLQVEHEGEFKEVTVLETNANEDTRVVQFEVENINALLPAKVSMVVGSYSATRDFRFQFDTTSIMPDTATEEENEDEIALEVGDSHLFTQPIKTTKEIKVNIEKEGVSFRILLPIGVTSITVNSLDKGDDSLIIDISVGNLGKEVKLTLPKPEKLTEEQVGAYHWNGKVWEYREARVIGDQVEFETDLSAVKIAEKVTVPENLNAKVVEGKIQLTWNAVKGATYDISKTVNGKEEIISNIESTSYEDTLNSDASVIYKIRAIKNQHQSSWSEPVTPSTTVVQGPELTDGEYSIDFRVLKYGTDQLSVMDGYTMKPAKLTIRDGKKTIAMGITNSSWITQFMVEQNGNLQSVREVSSDPSTDTRVVSFEVDDLSSKLRGWVKVDIPAINYHHVYDVHIEFDEGSIVPGVPNLTLEIDPQNLRDGEYQADFSVYEKGSYQLSIFDEYMKKPLAIKVYEGEMNISLALKKSSWITHFQVEQNGSYEEAEVLSRDEKADARIIEFPVTDLTRNINVKIKTPAESVVPKDGDYELEISLFEEESDETSNLLDYILPQGTLKVKDGKQYIHLTVNNSEQVEELHIEVEQEAVEVATKQNSAKNTREIEFEVDDLETEILLYVTLLTGNEDAHGTERLTTHVARLEVEAPELEQFDSYEVELRIHTDSIRVGAPDLTVESEVVLDEGDYTIDYRIVAVGQYDSALLEQYLQTPATLTVSKDGNQYVSLTLLESEQIRTIQLEQAGRYQEVEVDEETKAITFPLEDVLSEIKIKAQVQVETEQGQNRWETILFELHFDSESIEKVIEPVEEVIEVKEVNELAKEKAEIDEVEEVEVVQEIDFTVLKDGTNQVSVMDGYTLKPATVTTRDGQHHVAITLTNSSWIKIFQVELNGEYVEAQVIEEDQAKDTRVVQFEVPDLTQKINVFTHVSIPDGVLPFPYDNKYRVQFQFHGEK